MTGKRIAQDHPVRPVHRVLVELDRLAVLLLRVGEEVALDVLPPGDLQDRLRGDALVDVQGHGIGDAPLLLPLPRPLQPRLVVAEGLLEALHLLRFQLPFPRRLDEFGDVVGFAGAVEPQRRRQMRVVGPLDPLFPGDLPARLKPRRRNVQPRDVLVPVINNILPGLPRFRFPLSHPPTSSPGSVGHALLRDHVLPLFSPLKRPAPLALESAPYSYPQSPLVDDFR